MTNAFCKSLKSVFGCLSEYELAFQELNVLYEHRAKLAQLTAEHKAKVVALEQQVANLNKK